MLSVMSVRFKGVASKGDVFPASVTQATQPLRVVGAPHVGKESRWHETIHTRPITNLAGCLRRSAFCAQQHAIRA